MRLKTLGLLTFMPVALAVVVLKAAPAAGPATFVPHDIDAAYRGGYAVLTADFNKDGRVDVIANSLSVAEVAWYENPSWQRHVVVPEQRSIVMQAMNDLNGDGIPEIAFENAFAMQAANSEGIVSIARSQGDPKQPWKVEQIDKFPTSHHIAWADLDGDKKKELINAPLIGPKSLAPAYDQDKASVFWYSEADSWKRHILADANIPGIIHRVRPVNWNNNGREQVLIASFEGVVLYSATGSGAGMTFQKTVLTPGHATGPAPRLGASDVGVATQDGRRFFATVEPWHGNEVVVYNEEGGKWIRRVIYDQLASGHEIAVLDLNGDGRADVVANDNSRAPNQPAAAPRGGGAGAAGGRGAAGGGQAPATQNPDAAAGAAAQAAAGRGGAAGAGGGRGAARAPNGGVHVFYAPADPAKGEWRYQRLDDRNGMNGCVGADINNDKRPDLVCTGSGGVIRWYENTGVGK